MCVCGVCTLIRYDFSRYLPFPFFEHAAAFVTYDAQTNARVLCSQLFRNRTDDDGVVGGGCGGDAR